MDGVQGLIVVWASESWAGEHQPSDLGQDPHAMHASEEADPRSGPHLHLEVEVAVAAWGLLRSQPPLPHTHTQRVWANFPIPFLATQLIHTP